MVYDDALEWMWWAGMGYAGPVMRSSVGCPFVWRGLRGTIRDVTRNAVLVEWDGAAPGGEYTHRNNSPPKGKRK